MAVEHGLGALQSPPDERDFPIEKAYAMAGVTAPLKLASVYVVPHLPPVLNQGNTPMCTAFAASAMKSWEDYDDQRPNRFWNFDEVAFFRAIGGGSHGAYLRNAMDRIHKVGYPVVRNASPVGAHRCRAYYAVPKSVTAIQQAVASFGIVVMAMPWYHSWLTVGPSGIMRPADYRIGGHSISIIGWNNTRKAFLLRNSWGAWGSHGNCYMNYSVLVSHAWEIWKALD